MRRLGHHIYSSFSGQRTIWLSPWLEDLRDVLESRAQTCYHHPDQFDIIHSGGWWLITFIFANGQDHVGRPRQLVHQLLLSSKEAPAIFSPLFLREACLTRLSNEDPNVEHRLVHDMDQLDLTKLMPSPQEFGNVLRGSARPCLSGLLRILLHPSTTQDVSFSGSDAAMRELAAALCVVLLHRPDCHLSTLSQPLSPPPWCNQAPPLLRLKARESSASSHRIARVSSEHTMMAQPLNERGEWILDMVSTTQQPPRVLLLLRRIPLQSLLDEPHCGALMGVLLGIINQLGRDGTPQMDPRAAKSLHVLHIFHAAGAVEVCSAVLQSWHQASPGFGFDRLAQNIDQWNFQPDGPLQALIAQLPKLEGG